MSRKGNCNTFDEGADGYCRADGVASIVLKRLEDALADDDPIQGVIVAAGTNHSAEAVSMTRPHVGAQAFLLNKILLQANARSEDLSYIEMHGTGTRHGDAAEMTSVLQVFAPDQRRDKDRPLYLGSAKANIGHGESASGATSVIKILLMMRNNMIPPHCGIKTRINQRFPTDLQERNVHVATTKIPWTRSPGGRKVMVNNFSAAGGNTALLLEDAPTKEVSQDRDERTHHVVIVTAKSTISLQKNIQSLLNFMDENVIDELFLARLSYTTSARQLHHNHRVVAFGSTVEKIRHDLRLLNIPEDFAPAPATVSIAFAFSGQGSSYVGMGRQLYECFSQFRCDIEAFDRQCKSQGFPAILPMIMGTAKSSELDIVTVHLGIICLQMALIRLWEYWKVVPSIVIGHSLGEYAALYCASVFTATETIYLTAKRAQAIQATCSLGTHAMLAVKASQLSMMSFIDTTLELACINSPCETVISGPNGKINDLKAQLQSDGIHRSSILDIPIAYHSAQLDPALVKFEIAAQCVEFRKPRLPVILPLVGKVVTSEDANLLGSQYLVKQSRGVVDFAGALKAAKHTDHVTDKTIWVDVGAHPLCINSIKSTLGSNVRVVPTLSRNDDLWKVISGSLSTLFVAGVNIGWDEYHREFKSCHQVLPLPAYAWDNKDFWIQYANDWCLTKGNPPSTHLSKSAGSVFSSASVQKIIELRNDDAKAVIILESDLAAPELSEVVQGHRVNGAALAPSVSTAIPPCFASC